MPGLWPHQLWWEHQAEYVHQSTAAAQTVIGMDWHQNLHFAGKQVQTCVTGHSDLFPSWMIPKRQQIQFSNIIKTGPRAIHSERLKKQYMTLFKARNKPHWRREVKTSCQQEVSTNYRSLWQRSAQGHIRWPTSSMEQHQSAMHSIQASAGSRSPEGQCWAGLMAVQLDGVVHWQNEMDCRLDLECWTHCMKTLS